MEIPYILSCNSSQLCKIWTQNDIFEPIFLNFNQNFDSLTILTYGKNMIIIGKSQIFIHNFETHIFTQHDFTVEILKNNYNLITINNTLLLERKKDFIPIFIKGNHVFYNHNITFTKYNVFFYLKIYKKSYIFGENNENANIYYCEIPNNSNNLYKIYEINQYLEKTELLFENMNQISNKIYGYPLFFWINSVNNAAHSIILKTKDGSLHQISNKKLNWSKQFSYNFIDKSIDFQIQNDFNTIIVFFQYIPSIDIIKNIK